MFNKQLIIIPDDISERKGKFYKFSLKGNTMINMLDAYAYEHGLQPIIPTHVRPKNWKGHYSNPRQYDFLTTHFKIGKQKNF